MVSRKHEGNNAGSVEESIIKFLQKRDVPYSEPRLIKEVFNITEEDEEMPVSREEIERLRKIKETLRRLVGEKKIFTATFEDADTKEQVPHYSTKGWFVTP